MPTKKNLSGGQCDVLVNPFIKNSLRRLKLQNSFDTDLPSSWSWANATANRATKANKTRTLMFAKLLVEETEDEYKSIEAMAIANLLF